MNPRAFGSIVLLCSALALGASAAETHAQSPRTVEIHVEGSAAALERVRTVATELLAEVTMMPVVLGEGEETPPETPFVRAYLDLRASPARLVIVDGASDRELERRTLSDRATLEAAVESAAHVLLMVVEARLDEQQATDANAEAGAGARPNPPPPRAPAETGAPVPPVTFAAPNAPVRDAGVPPSSRASAHAAAPVRVDLGLLARGVYLGEGHFLPGAGAVVAVDLERTKPFLGFELSLSGHSALELGSGRATATLNPLSFTAVPNVRARFTPGVEGSLGLGVALTWFRLKSEGPPDVWRASSAGGVDPALMATLAVRARLAARWSVALTGALAADLAPREFVALVGEERQELAKPSSLRPSIALAGAYSLFGPALEAGDK